jgi:hypothetical protein
MKKSEKHSRRKFLSLGFLTGAVMLAPDVKAQSPESATADEETVMLLTPDGKLVEVKKSIVQGAKSGSKVSNQEILTWANPPKTKS